MDHAVAVTGGHGFVGSAVCERLVPTHTVHLLGRHDGDLPWSLEEAGTDLPDDVGAVVHCAWAVTPRTLDMAETNVNGSLRLLARAKRKGAIFVFISTMSASDATTSIYGGSKRAVEQQVLKYGRGYVVRPGTISDAQGRLGMLDSSLRRVANLPISPRISPDPWVPIVGLDRVVGTIVDLTSGTEVDHEHDLVDSWVPLSEVVTRLVVGGRTRRSLPIPGAFVTGATKLGRRIPVAAARDLSDSWLGLMDASTRRPT